jgi:DNA-binding IclR family transcriptional regulator
MKNAMGSSPSAKRPYTVKSLGRALNILELLAEGEESAYSITQLSRRLHLPVSTVHRLLANLVRHGFAEAVPGTHAFRLSFKMLRMGLRVLDGLDFRFTAQPLLQELNQRTQETVHLAILQGTRAICIEKFEGPRPVGLDASPGKMMPLHCTAVGKILMAYQRVAFLTEVARAAGLRRFTPHTISSLANLRKEREQIREQGYALEQEEAAMGLRCVAGPLFDHNGRVVAAFGVAGPATRLTPARLPKIVNLVRATSKQISFRLGHRRQTRRWAGGQMGR